MGYQKLSQGHVFTYFVPIRRQPIGDVDTLQDVLTCSVLKQYHTSKEVTDRNVEYNDIYSEDIFKLQKVTELYNQLLDVRNKVIQSTLVAYITGRMHGFLAVQNLL